jgi:hypothetical protein
MWYVTNYFSGANLALHEQSQTYQSTTKYVSTHAIHGTRHTYECSLTQIEDHSWWAVDLGTIMKVTSVVVTQLPEPIINSKLLFSYYTLDRIG